MKGETFARSKRRRMVDLCVQITGRCERGWSVVPGVEDKKGGVYKSEVSTNTSTAVWMGGVSVTEAAVWRGVRWR